MEIKPGMLVRITKNVKNWNKSMDQYVGTIQEIESVEDSFYGQRVTFKSADNKINEWSWIYQERHFEVLNCNTGPTKEQILRAAKTSHQAEEALRELFPEVFKNPYDHLVKFENIKGESLSNPCDIGNILERSGITFMILNGCAPNEDAKFRMLDEMSGNQMVIFDRNGKEVYRTNGKYCFGFVKNNQHD
jgi:hypothetical protein